MTFNCSGKKDPMSMRLKAQNLQYAQNETKQLTEDSTQMERRLSELKLVMSHEKQQREAQGGGFWNKGQPGTLGSYAKQVLDKPCEKVTKGKRVRVLKNEPINVIERSKGPGTMGFLAQRTSAGSGKEARIKGPRCGQCEEKGAHVSCLECAEDYCAGCFAAFHLRGALRKHRSQPLGVNTIRTPRLIQTDGQLVMRPAPDLPVKANEPSGLLTSQQTARDHQSRHAKTICDVSLLDGDYNEEESAASFKQAVAAWRNGSGDAVPQAQRSTPSVTSSETSTSTITPSPRPLIVTFHSNLSYAEQLLLKRHRRTDVPSLVSAKPEPTDMNAINGNADDADEDVADSTDPVDFKALFDVAVEAEAERLRSKPTEERSESALSIIELPEDTSPNSFKLPLSSRYAVDLPDDSDTKSNITCTSFRQREEIDLPISLPEELPREQISRACTVLPSGVQILRYDDAAEIIEVAQPASKNLGIMKKTTRSQSRAGSGARSRVKSGCQANPRNNVSRPGSRQDTSSRTFCYGAGELTKAPSANLHEVASLNLRGQTSEATDLSSFFTAGKRQPFEERVLRPSGKKQHPDNRLKPSNRLYQMAPRSWRPDSNLGDTLTDEQLGFFPQTTQHFRINSEGQLARSNVSANDRPDEQTSPATSCIYSPQTPPCSRLSHDRYSPRSRQQTTGTENACAVSAHSSHLSGRISQMIVVEGGDPSIHEMEELAVSRLLQAREDADTLEELQWELSSQKQPAEGCQSRGSILTPQLDDSHGDGDHYQAEDSLDSVDSDQEFDTAVRFREEDLEDDFVFEESGNFSEVENEVRALQ